MEAQTAHTQAWPCLLVGSVCSGEQGGTRAHHDQGGPAWAESGAGMWALGGNKPHRAREEGYLEHKEQEVPGAGLQLGHRVHV